MVRAVIAFSNKLWSVSFLWGGLFLAVQQKDGWLFSSFWAKRFPQRKLVELKKSWYTIHLFLLKSSNYSLSDWQVLNLQNLRVLRARNVCQCFKICLQMTIFWNFGGCILDHGFFSVPVLLSLYFRVTARIYLNNLLSLFKSFFSQTSVYFG